MGLTPLPPPLHTVRKMIRFERVTIPGLQKVFAKARRSALPHSCGNLNTWLFLKFTKSTFKEEKTRPGGNNARFSSETVTFFCNYCAFLVYEAIFLEFNSLHYFLLQSRHLTFFFRAVMW